MLPRNMQSRELLNNRYNSTEKKKKKMSIAAHLSCKHDFTVKNPARTAGVCLCSVFLTQCSVKACSWYPD